MADLGQSAIADQTQVQDRMNQLSIACDQLDKAVASIEERLSSVLRQENLVVSKSGDEKHPTLVELAEHLDKRICCIRLATDRLLSIRQRTEL